MACTSFNFAKRWHFRLCFGRFAVELSVPTLACNVLGLGEGGEIEAQMFSLAQMFIRIPNVQFSTKAPLLPNPC
jgi:hypothetical protein